MSDEFDDLDPLGPAGAEPEDDYVVGPGKPPKHGTWVKGRSGNPKGRPKEIVNLIASFNAMMDEVDVAVADGRTMSKGEAFVHSLIKQACKCDQKAFAKFLGLLKQAGLLEPAAPAPDKPARSARAGRQSMDEFKAGFGKPLPPSDDGKAERSDDGESEEEKQ